MSRPFFRFLLCLASGRFAAGAPAGAVEAPAALQYQLATAAPGAVLDVTGLDKATSAPVLSVTKSFTGGTLLYSDSPEYVPAPGILYADTLAPGPARLMVYHVNAAPQDLKLAVIVEPAVPGTVATLTLRRRVVYGPSTAYGYVGSRAAYDFVSAPDAPTTLTISAPTLLDQALEQASKMIHGGALLEGIYDFDVADAGVRVTVAALDVAADTLSSYAALPLAPREVGANGKFVHDRGTYPNDANKSVTMGNGSYNTSQGAALIRLGGGASDAISPDANAGEGSPAGFDALLGIPSTLRGNFGVLYTIRIPVRSTDGRRVAVLLNPRGGGYSGAASISASLVGAGAVYVPASGSVSLQTQGTLVGRWDPALTPEITIVWSPAGASSLPVGFLLVPYPEPGDTTGDGVVSLRDAALALRFAAKLSTPSARQLVAADVAPSGAPDGQVTMADAAWIVGRAGGLR